MQPNLSRFIVIFLAISLVTSSLLLAFSSYINRPRTAASETRPESGTAFTAKVPEAPEDPEIAALRKRDNMTAEMAGVLADKILQSNPEGPAEQNGSLAIALPKDLDAALDSYVEKNPPSAAVLRPNVDITSLNVLRSSSPSDITHYSSQVAEILTEMMPAEDALDAADPEGSLIAARDQMNAVFIKLKAVPVPSSLLLYHKALLESYDPVLRYGNLAVDDPVAAVALADAAEQISARQIQALKAQAAEANKALEKMPAAPKTSWLDTFDFAPKAHALAGMGVPIADAPGSPNYLDIFKKAALGYVKDKLLKKMAAQVLGWIAGKGKPQFVTNWQGFLAGAVDEGAGEVINKLAPQLCNGPNAIGEIVGLGDLAGFIRRVMTPIDTGGAYYGSYPQCTLSQAVQNIEDFQKDIRNGGWLGYASMLEPQNTVFGNLSVIADKQMIELNKAYDSARAKAVSGAGFVGEEVCDNNLPPGKAPSISCSPGDEDCQVDRERAATLGPNECFDGSKPHVITPGKTAGDVTSATFDYAYARIVNAQDWQSMLSIIVNTTLDRLSKKAMSGILGAVKKSSGPGGGGVYSPPTDPPSENALGLARQLLETKTVALENALAAKTALAGPGGTIPTFQLMITQCSETFAAIAAQSVQDLSVKSYALEVKVVELRPVVENTLPAAIASLEANPNALSRAQLEAQFGTLTAAQKEATDLGTDRQAAEEALQNAQELFTSCSAEVPPEGGGESGSGTP